MGLLTLTQIPCHYVLANEVALNLKYRIGLKHFFNINLGIGIIKKTTFFVCIFDISPCVFTQISIGRARWECLVYGVRWWRADGLCLFNNDFLESERSKKYLRLIQEKHL